MGLVSSYGTPLEMEISLFGMTAQKLDIKIMITILFILKVHATNN
jgi:hypothetical protein